MSNYTRQNDFSAKDSLATGNPAKLIKGSEVDEEFDALVTAVATKLDAVGGATEGNVATLTSTGLVQDGGEALADLTVNTDTDVSGNSWVLDEDTMSSDDATKVPTQQSVKAYVDSAVQVFVSTPVTSVTATLQTEAHGFGAVPDIMQIEFVCVTANNGYSVDDVLIVNPAIHDNDEGTSTTTRSNLLTADTTNIYFALSQQFVLPSKTTPGSIGSYTAAQWNMRVRGIKF